MSYLSGAGADPNFLGYFATPSALISAYPIGFTGAFAVVGSTDTIWVWDDTSMSWIDTGSSLSLTLNQISSNSTTAPDSIYNMTPTVPVLFTSTGSSSFKINSDLASSSFTSTDYGQLHISNNSIVTGAYSKITFGNLFASNLPTSAIGVRFTNAGSYMDFGTSNSYPSITNTAMTIDPSGNILVNTASAIAKFNVVTSSPVAGSFIATSSTLTVNATADSTQIVLNTGAGAGTTRGYIGADSVSAFKVFNNTALNVLANINNSTGTLNILPRSAYTAINDISGLVVGGSGSVTNANISMGISGSNANIIQSRDGTNNTWALTIQPYGGLLKIGGNTYADGSVISLGAAISGGYNGTTGSYNARGGASGINRFFVGENNNTSSISVIELRALGSGSSVNPMGRFNVASYLVSGNFTGTSVPIANTTYIDASATGYSGSATGNFVKLSSSEISIIGSTATNTGTRLDSNGFRIDLISNIHTTNSANYSFQVAGGSIGKNVDYSAFKTSGSFNTYQSFGTWDAYGSDSATGQKLAIGGFRSSQWNELNLYTSGSNRMSINSSGNVNIATKLYLGGISTAPTALLHLNAGTATVNTAPLKFTAGTPLTTPEAGVFEFSNSETGLTFTAVSTRRAVVLDTATQTLTNKRITPRVVTTTQSATPTINTDNGDVFDITGLAQAITSFTTNLSGTPTAYQKLIITITDDGTARAITWGSSFESSTVTLPTTTVISTLLTVGFLWNSVTSKWRCVAVA